MRGAFVGWSGDSNQTTGLTRWRFRPWPLSSNNALWYPASVTARTACALFILAFSGAFACSSSDDAGNAPANDAGGSDSALGDAPVDAPVADGATDGATGADAAGDSAGACLADGKYGKCTENPGCFCLQGATVYQFCTVTCQTAAECGEASKFPGATPGCYPINPGAAENICALVCTDASDCPCGLTCTASGVGTVKICAELQ